MSNQPSLITIQQNLPEKHWPIVFGALRNDELVWQAFSDPDFISAAVAHCGPEPVAWSPANLALMLMGLKLDAIELRQNAGQFLPSGARKQAILLFDQYRRAESVMLPGLTEAGWLALALRERYRMLKSWHGLLDEIGSERLCGWSTAFTCLVGMLSDPVDCLTVLAADQAGLNVIVKAILSQPEFLEKKAERLAQIALRIPITTRLRLLRFTTEKSPSLGQAVAGLLLRGTDQIDHVGERVDELSQPADEAVWLEVLPNFVYQTTLQSLNGQPAKARQSALSTHEYVGALSSRMITHNCLASLAVGDISSALQAIDLPSQSLQPNDRQSLALTLLKKGQAEKALELAGQDQNSALYLLVQSRLLEKETHTTAAQTTILTAFEHALEGQIAATSFDLLDEMTTSLLELNRPVEAAQLFGLLLKFRPDEASLYAGLARSERLAGNPGPAVEAAYMAVALQPQNLDYHTEQALALESSGEWQAAYATRQAIFNRLHKVPKAGSNARTWVQTDDLRVLARSALQAGQTEQAQALAQQALEQSPENGLIYVILGDICRENGDKSLALQHYEKANDLSPNAPETWLALSSACLAEQEQEKAVETLKMAVQALPDAPALHLALGDLFSAQDCLTDALHQYRRSAELLKLSIPDLEQETGELAPAIPISKRPFLDTQAAAVYLRLGKTLNQLGRHEESRQVLALPFATQEHRQDSAPLYAKSLIANGEYRDALSALAIAFKAGQSDRDLAMDYARALIHVGENPERAVNVLETLINEEPDNYEALGLMAEALAASGSPHEALDYYQQTLDTRLVEDPGWFVRVSIGLGHVALELGKTNLALATLQEAIQSAPNHTALHQKLSEVYLAANLNEDALAAARRTVELAPADVVNLVWFSEIALQLGADVEAINTLKRAVELSPNEASLVLKLAKVQIRAGDKEAAHQNYNRLAANPGITLNQLHHVARGLLDLSDAPGAVACLERLREPSLPSIDPISVDLLFDLAEAYEKVEELQAALQIYEEILARNPHLVSAHKRKARLHIYLGAPLAALACLEHTLQLVPGDRDSHLMLMSIHYAEGNLDQAIYHVQKAATSARQSIDAAESLQAQYLAAALNWLALDITTAYKNLQVSLSWDSIDATPDTLNYICLKAQLEFELGLEAEALKTSEQFATRVSDQPVVLAAQARLHLLLGDTEQACGKLSQAMAAIHGDGVQAATEYATIITTALQLADFEVAEDALERWLAHNPCEPLPHLLHMKFLVLRAEEQHYLTLMQVVQHAHGEQVLDIRAAEAFKHALETALKHLPGVNPTTSVELANAYTPDELKTWQMRAEAVFSDPPSNNTLKRLGHLEPTIDNAFAYQLALIRAGQGTQVALAEDSELQNPRLLALRALALQELEPARALATALAAIENTAQVQSHAVEGSQSDSRALSHHLNQAPIFSALLATVALRVGNPSQAMQAITTALEAWPDEPGWHTLAAEICKKLGNSRGLIQHLEKTVYLLPESVDEKIELAEAYVQAGLYNKAIQHYEAAFSQHGNSPAIALRLGQIHLLRTDLDQAESWIMQAIDLDRGQVDAHLLYAELCLRRHDHQQAHHHIESALSLQPDNPQSLYKLASCLVAQNRKEEAIRVLDQVIKYSNDPLMITLEKVALVRSVYGVKRAIEELIPIEEQYGHHPSVVGLLAEYLYEHGQSKMALEMAQAALQAESAMEAEGNGLAPEALSRLHYLTGRLERRTGQLDQAVHHLSKALQIVPDNLDVFLELGQTYQDRRELNQALQVYQKAIHFAPDDPRPYRQAGMALKDSKDYLEAERMIRKAAELSPHDISIHRLLGSLVALNLVHNAG